MAKQNGKRPVKQTLGEKIIAAVPGKLGDAAANTAFTQKYCMKRAVTQDNFSTSDIIFNKAKFLDSDGNEVIRGNMQSNTKYNIAIPGDDTAKDEVIGYISLKSNNAIGFGEIKNPADFERLKACPDRIQADDEVIDEDDGFETDHDDVDEYWG